LALALGDPDGDVQEPVAQSLRCTDGEVTVQVGGLGPGDQVAGGQGRVQPDRVEGDLPGGEPAQAGVLGAADASSTRVWARCRASSQAKLPDLGVGGEGLEPPTVDIGEPQLRPRMGPSRRTTTRKFLYLIQEQAP